MSRVLIALLMLSTTAHADGVNMPAVQAGKYSEAVNKALKAAAVQTGVQGDLDLIVGAGQKQATKAGEQVIATVTPFNPKTVYAVVGTGYALGVKKEFKKSFKNPLFPSITNTIVYSGKDSKKTTLIWGVSF